MSLAWRLHHTRFLGKLSKTFPGSFQSHVPFSGSHQDASMRERPVLNDQPIVHDQFLRWHTQGNGLCGQTGRNRLCAMTLVALVETQAPTLRLKDPESLWAQVQHREHVSPNTNHSHTHGAVLICGGHQLVRWCRLGLEERMGRTLVFGTLENTQFCARLGGHVFFRARRDISVSVFLRTSWTSVIHLYRCRSPCVL